MPALSSTDRQMASDALLDAFDRDGLEQLFYFRLDRTLDRVTGGGTMNKIVMDVLRRSEQEGWTPELLSAARDERPRNATIAAAAAALGLAAAAPAGRQLERMISAAAGMLDPVEWRGRLGQIETQVCRIEIPVTGGSIRGTGFLVGSDMVMTNHHVVESLMKGDAEVARVRLRFDYKRLADGVTVNPGIEAELDADDWLIASAPPSEVDNLVDPGDRVPAPGELDFALLRLATDVGAQAIGTNPPPDAPKRSWIALDEAQAPSNGSPVFIMQHPSGEPVKLAIDSIISVKDTRIRYKANTEGGSSGSPCFDINLNLIALHHSGDPDFDPEHKPEYNEGIPVNAIVRQLDDAGVPLAPAGG